MEKKIGLETLVPELQRLSGKISDQTRTLALSIIAMSWALLIGKEKAAHDGKLLLVCGVLALSSLVLDYAQYVSGYLYTDRLRRLCEVTKAEVQFDYENVFYRLREVSFWLKQWALVPALLFFLLAVIQNLRV